MKVLGAAAGGGETKVKFGEPAKRRMKEAGMTGMEAKMVSMPRQVGRKRAVKIGTLLVVAVLVVVVKKVGEVK